LQPNNESVTYFFHPIRMIGTNVYLLPPDVVGSLDVIG